jgi:hypothetical protein
VQSIKFHFGAATAGAGMTKPHGSYRRIDRLKAIAFDCGFTNQTQTVGKLSKTATWEALLETYGIPSQVVDTVDN